MLKQVQHENKGDILVSVIPNPVLNHALKQVQGLLTSGSKDFGISVWV
jgi:hypothetical protein